MYEPDTVVELEGVNGEWFNLTEGDRGIFLGTGVTGLYDPPVKVVYEEPGNYPGARYLNHRILRRDIVFQVLILNDKSNNWLSLDSEWRKAWAFDRDCKLYITTPESGRRYLKLRLGESPDISLETDPKLGRLNVAKMVCIAGDPFWYEDDVVYHAETKTDTRFQPTIFDGVFPWNKLPQEDLTIKVDPSDGKGGLNPTDQYVWGKWTLPGSKEPIPGITIPIVDWTIAIPWDKAPFTQWVIPDYSFEDESKANRRLKLPGLILGEDSVVDTDPRVEQITAASGSQVWARMNGVRFRHPIPPWTKSREYKLSVAGCAPGQIVTLRIPRPWSRPWGLES
ncbi:phage tail protein [Mycobacterium avium]|uniref:phage tail protein n=1 Tax=Mycobacterium avium TaxID=1764 RepID=UPI000CE4B62A|nr:phage tail protein [Mycobacterium avium]